MSLKTFVLATLVAFTLSPCYAASDSETFDVTSPIHVLKSDDLGAQPSETAEPYKSGELSPAVASQILSKLQIAIDRPTIIHVVRWGDEKHTTVRFQKWYLLNQGSPTGGFYLLSAQKLFEETYLPGVRNFRLVFIHLNFNLNNPSESIAATAASVSPQLVFPVSYKIVVTKQESQFVQDVKTLLQIEGLTGAAAAAATTLPGYYAYSDIATQFTTASITITPSLNKQPAPIVGSTGGNGSNVAQKSNSLTSNTYTNEAPTYYGLSVAVPVSGYKDVTYQSSGNTLVPASTTKKNAYATFDLYVPPAIPGLMTFRYIPHPFVGLPFSGKVFQFPMAGLAVGSPWFEAYAGAVFDREYGAVNGSAGKTKVKWSFGFKISMSAAAKALKGAGGGSNK